MLQLFRFMISLQDAPQSSLREAVRAALADMPADLRASLLQSARDFVKVLEDFDGR